jgi:hypothetical protein
MIDKGSGLTTKSIMKKLQDQSETAFRKALMQVGIIGKEADTNVAAFAQGMSSMLQHLQSMGALVVVKDEDVAAPVPAKVSAR